MAAEHTPVAAHLPAAFAAETDSFAQVEGFLAMVDELHRAYLDRLADLPAWLSPSGAAWPPGTSPQAGGDVVLNRLDELYGELATWFGFVLPGSWSDPGTGLARRRAFLAKAARLWRRRGTPRGFADWFCLWFGIKDPAERPVLLEHFKYGSPESQGGDTGPDPALRATLVVPATDRFADVAVRAEAAQFTDRYAPAHVLMRLCWARPGFTLDPVPGPGADPAAVEEFRARVRGLLCSMVDFIDHQNGVRLWDCVDEGRAIDRLDVGRLPSDDEEA
ncbi:hypothetical protein [Nonomuraea bangladeshensis]|uniref:hypothetical protein n=1 Tax=Nonomuraea bangladeshensis TaxID=404385 RepID=UPI003C2C69CA